MDVSSSCPSRTAVIVASRAITTIRVGALALAALYSTITISIAGPLARCACWLAVFTGKDVPSVASHARWGASRLVCCKGARRASSTAC